MKINSYQEIKKYIIGNLQNKENLSDNEITKEIKNARKLNVSDRKIFAQFLRVPYLEKLSEMEWKRLEKEVRQYFDVEMEEGIIIQGEEQQKRDTSWWTDREKQKGDNYYWERYKQYIGKSLQSNVVRTIDIETDKIMNNIENPAVDKFSRYGMVIGHVQSGKTANYSSLICKAADAGYKFIVVIAGGINNLRNQTQKRLNEAFVGKDQKRLVGVGKLGNVKKELEPISLTTALIDFNKRDAEKNSQGLNFDNVNAPILLVIKKNTRTLDNVIEWISNQYNHKKISDHAMLVIDDECDYASINTKEEEDPTTINKKLRTLISLFKKSTYVAYTATPYANIFIDHKVDRDDIGKDLFPKDFICTLKAPSNYFGARKIFLDSDGKHLRKIDDFEDIIPLKHKKDIDLDILPNSLYEAIRVFIINIGVRYLLRQDKEHNSMLIHITRFTRVHQQIAALVEEYVIKLRKEIKAYGALEDAEKHSDFIRSIKETYEAECKHLEFTWKEVLDSICNIIETVVIREVHQSSTVKLEYKKNKVTNAIVVGGTSVSRGFTLEGLSVSYFLRSTIFYDTLMQMGRWFGYRFDYEDLCRIYMTDEMMDNFGYIIESTEELMNTLKIMDERDMTPNDFGLSVVLNPNTALQVTARNKQKNTKDIDIKMTLDGYAKETSWLYSDLNIRKNNLQDVEEVIKKLQANKNPYFQGGSGYLWSDIDKNVIANFLEKFKPYLRDSFLLQSRMPIDWIKQYVNDVDTKWDIALYSGQGKEYSIGDIRINKEQRKVEIKDGFYEIKNRQVSSGIAESVVFPENERKKLGSNRIKIREKMKKPLLMLHILEAKKYDKDEKNQVVVDKSLAAFGISFPGKRYSGSKIIKINTVYIEKLQKLLNDEEEFDD